MESEFESLTLNQVYLCQEFFFLNKTLTHTGFIGKVLFLCLGLIRQQRCIEYRSSVGFFCSLTDKAPE